MPDIAARSSRLLYEPLTARHALDLCDALTDAQVYAHLPGDRPTTAADLERQFACMAAGPRPGQVEPDRAHPDQSQQVWWNFAVRLHSGEAIGRIQATIHHGLAETAYLFGPRYWGHGYATEALRWLHEQLAADRRADTAWATVVPENTRSIRLLERVGYLREPTARPHLLSYAPGDQVYRAPLSAMT